MKKFLTVILFAALASPQSRTPLVSKADLNVVRVTVRVEGLQVHPRTVKPGKVQFWIENRTLLSRPELSISSLRVVAGKEEREAKAKLEVRGTTRRTWVEATLTPGTYALSINGVPGLQKTLTVGQ